MSNIIHKRNIEKGNFGDFSKIEEEFQELKDANEQHCKVLEICEICDLIGAVNGYVKKHYNMSIYDIYRFSEMVSSNKSNKNEQDG